MSECINVTMLDVLQPAFEEWLHSRGLGLMQIPASEDEEEARVTPFVVIIPPGSPLEAMLQ